ncbi:MAG: hypothetical protein R3C49_17195 [Planctomycetaceae bacterium]
MLLFPSAALTVVRLPAELHPSASFRPRRWMTTVIMIMLLTIMLTLRKVLTTATWWNLAMKNFMPKSFTMTIQELWKSTFWIHPPPNRLR